MADLQDIISQMMLQLGERASTPTLADQASNKSSSLPNQEANKDIDGEIRKRFLLKKNPKSR
jgi:hypothetical protein